MNNSGSMVETVKSMVYNLQNNPNFSRITIEDIEKMYKEFYGGISWDFAGNTKSIEAIVTSYPRIFVHRKTSSGTTEVNLGSMDRVVKKTGNEPQVFRGVKPKKGDVGSHGGHGKRKGSHKQKNGKKSKKKAGLFSFLKKKITGDDYLEKQLEKEMGKLKAKKSKQDRKAREKKKKEEDKVKLKEEKRVLKERQKMKKEDERRRKNAKKGGLLLGDDDEYS